VKWLSQDTNQIADTRRVDTNSLCICSILRIWYIVRLYYRTYDVTWDAQPAWLWLIVEANLAVICASAPALKVFFKHTVDSPSSSYCMQHTPYGKQSKLSSKNSESSTIEEGGGERSEKITWNVSVDVETDFGSVTSTLVPPWRGHQTFLDPV
jgi:hypothetical protein